MLTEDELDGVAGITGLWSHQGWAGLYRLILNRPVTSDEVIDAHRRLNERRWVLHPEEKAAHDRYVAEFQALERSTTPAFKSSL